MSTTALVESAPGASLAAEGGVIPASIEPFALTSVGTASAPAWSVGVGQAVVQRTVGGTYIGTWDQAKTIAVELPLPSSGQTRIDLVVCDILDPEADGTWLASSGGAPATGFRVRTVTGSAATSPAIPGVPAGTVPLWRYNVAANGTLSNVVSMRNWTRATGGVRLVETGDTRAGSHPGDQRIFRNGQVDAWILVGASYQWVTTVSAPAWTAVEPALNTLGFGSFPAGPVGLGTGGVKRLRYKRVGNDLTFSYEFRWGTQPFSNPAGFVVTYLPNGWVTPAGRDQWFPSHIWVNDPVSGVNTDYIGQALVQASSNVVRLYFSRANGSGRGAAEILPWRIATGAGPGNSIPYIPGGYAQGGAVHCSGVVELA